LGSLGASITSHHGSTAASQAAGVQAARKLSCSPSKGSLGSGPSSPVSPGMQRLHDRRGALKSLSLPQLPDPLKEGSSMGPPKDGIFSRNWCSDAKRLLHEHKQREWLRQQNKHHYIDFSDVERTELRKSFDALANGEETVGLQKLENMLISLGLASTQQEVKRMVDGIDTNGNGELDFEEYLMIFRNGKMSEMFQIFKALMEGRLGDRNLNFQMVISNYRRNLFLKATGATAKREEFRLPQDGFPVDHGMKILHNFAGLQRGRYHHSCRLAETGEGPDLDKYAMPFDPTGDDIPPGTLSISWRGVTHEYGLVSSRPSSADRSKRAVPESPRTVIAKHVGVHKPKKRNGPHGATVMIQAPALEETSSSRALLRNSMLRSQG